MVLDFSEELDLLVSINRLDAEGTEASPREIRMNLYYGMAMIALVPIQVGEKKRLPRCVVEEVQRLVPGGCVASESVVSVRRKADLPGRLVLSVRSHPVAYEYPDSD